MKQYVHGGTGKRKNIITHELDESYKVLGSVQKIVIRMFTAQSRVRGNSELSILFCDTKGGTRITIDMSGIEVFPDGSISRTV